MKIVVIFGSKSVEHEISIISAFQVIEALEVKYEVYPVYISKNNEFYYDKKMTSVNYFNSNLNKTSKKNLVKFNKNGKGFYFKGKRKVYFDLIFPIVHGKGGEDGSVLNYFKFKGFPIVGNDACFYALAQNKALTKRVLDGLNIDNVKYKLIERDSEYKKDDFDFPVIVKPNNLGSSLGVNIANNFIELERAISYEFRIDNQVLVETYLKDCREFNIAVINNNGEIETSEIEEVKKSSFFTFDEKYLSGGKKKGLASSKRETSKDNISKEIRKEIESKAKTIYREMNASGVIRIDFLYSDKLYVNEINSIPGSYAYYLWENKYDFLELLDIVIKESKRNIFFENKSNELIDKSVIFRL